jgi:hypothetical protein
MKKALILFAVVLAILLISLVLLPSTFSFHRSVIIERNKEVPFSAVASFRNWQYWSPWSDSSFQITYRGPETHVGAEMLWQRGENESGSNKIMDFKPYDYIKVEAFINRFAKPIFMEFQFQDKALNKCEVTWTQSGKLSFFERPFGFLMEKAMSKDIEQGLKNLKASSELGTAKEEVEE